MKKAALILKEKYNGDIPKTYKELNELPGIGPSLANTIMFVVWNENSGIVIDSHVHRVANRLEWTKTKTNTAEKTRKELEEWLPKYV